MKRYYYIFFLFASLFLLFGCSKNNLDLPDGWEKIPGEYKGNITVVNINQNQPNQSKEYTLDANIQLIDDQVYSIHFEETDSASLTNLELRIVDVNHIWAYFDVEENDKFEKDNKLEHSNRFTVIHSEEDDIGIGIKTDPQIQVDLCLKGIYPNSSLKVLYSGIKYL